MLADDLGACPITNLLTGFEVDCEDEDEEALNGAM